MSRSLRICLTAIVSTVLIATQSPAWGQPRTRVTVQDGFSLAFVDADVRRVVDAVLGEMLELDYSVDPAVSGNITLRTREPVRRSELLSLLEAALGPLDAVILVQGQAYRVVPRAGARGQAPIAAAADAGASSPRGFATEVITIRNGSAEQIAQLVRQFLGEEAVAGVNDAYNQLVIVGTADERRATRAIIERFDVDTLATSSLEVYRLENVDAETLVDELERIFAPPFDIIGSRVRLVPLPRLRSVLAIAAERADLVRVEPWIRRLDAGVSGKRRLYSYAVQNGRARDLAISLQLVLGMTGTSDQTLSQSPAQNSIETLSANSIGLEPEQAIGGQTPLPGSSTPILASSGPGPRIVPNEPNNSLLLYADGEEYEFILDALRRLDQPVAQVLIEATLAEVTLTDDLRFGVDFSILTGSNSITSSTNASGIPASIFPGFSVSIIGRTADAVLNTLQSRTNVRVLSAPKLMVLNNQTATLQVGDQVPIVTQQAQGVAAPGAPIVNTVELRDTGVILRVTPRVNDSGVVTLDIAQEVSEVARTTTSGINSPTIQQRRIASTVATRSGQMVALGGLIRNGFTDTRSGIPLLSQIPLIGGLFGSQNRVGIRTELIILLTPTVVVNPDAAAAAAASLLKDLDQARSILEMGR